MQFPECILKGLSTGFYRTIQFLVDNCISSLSKRCGGKLFGGIVPTSRQIRLGWLGEQAIVGGGWVYDVVIVRWEWCPPYRCLYVVIGCLVWTWVRFSFAVPHLVKPSSGGFEKISTSIIGP